MPTLANDLVQFLMHLFGNRKAIQAFLDDPERALAEHGLGNVCLADVDAAMPVVLDYAPITVSAPSFEREYSTGGSSAWTAAGASAAHAGGAAAMHSGSQATARSGVNYDQDDHAYAVQQLHHVVNHFSYTTSTTMVDDRDTITDQSVNQNIWADGDVEQWFDNDAVVAAGDHAVAAGDDADLRDSNNIRDSYNTDHSTDNSMDNSIHAGGDVSIGNEETDISDSFNTDVGLDVDDSFNDNSDNADYSDHSDHTVSTDTDVDIQDSFNDNSDNSTTTEVEDSFNQDNSTTTAVEVDVEDSFQDNSVTSIAEDNVVVTDNQLDFTEDNSSHTDVDLDNQTTIDDSVVDDSTVL
ncbi:IniB N-terminal domain-containing protein [Pseudarthrobacter sp. BRE9]|uniref:IniB N-terminal domain-containing protein n=1 Tax=Pseudarthrobacter sp. BRE9 TaxID=2962582 RepID=UPI002881EF82|nr:IniB N-terminal domain-containing protein [Pseudarthrobacter sp. BRE9]MDT0168273.1 IniB N-terminal domain-containing protein [Pseudarthrobacter sp. BRE9]